MQLEDLKWWVWITVGVMLGGVIGLVRAGWGPTFDTDTDVTLTPRAFQQRIVNQPPQSQGRRVTVADFFQDIIVHPPLQDDLRGAAVYLLTLRAGDKTLELEITPDGRVRANGPAPSISTTLIKPVYWKAVTQDKVPKEVMEAAEAAVPNGAFVKAQTGPFRVTYWITGVERFEPKVEKPDPSHPEVRVAVYRGRRFKSEAVVPYVPDRRTNWTLVDAPGVEAAPTGVLGQRSYPTVIDYLKALQGKYPRMSFRYAWWDEPAYTIGLWTAGSTAAVGFIWPLALWTMTGQWQRSLKEQEKRRQVKLSRAARKAATRAAKGKGGKGAAPAEPEKSLKTLEEELAARFEARVAAAPVEPAAAPAAEEKPAKAFGTSAGDFYPTEIHGEQKKD